LKSWCSEVGTALGSIAWPAITKPSCRLFPRSRRSSSEDRESPRGPAPARCRRTCDATHDRLPAGGREWLEPPPGWDFGPSANSSPAVPACLTRHTPMFGLGGKSAPARPRAYPSTAKRLPKGKVPQKTETFPLARVPNQRFAGLPSKEPPHESDPNARAAPPLSSQIRQGPDRLPNERRRLCPGGPLRPG